MVSLHRDIIEKLAIWKNSHTRKPLIIQGARQIGKTWVMKRFGETHYRHVAYFNFDASEELCREFENTKDPHRLLGILRLYTDARIVPHETLIIMDEIQQCNKALNSLKYFCESAPEYHVMAAGSLLGVALSKGDSFPVGKVDFQRMYPVTFKEFLRVDDRDAFDYMEGMTTLVPLPEVMMGRLKESYRRYRVCGGMPAAAVAMLEGETMERVETIQRDILTSYSLDFAKHAPAKDIPKITSIWHSIPSQLARENRKFVYKLVKPGARAREYEDALLWLQQAGLVYRVFCSSKPGLPLMAYDDLSAFKIYMCDTGLLRAMAGLPPEIFADNNPMFQEFKGALAENDVLQSLMAQFEVMPRYWVSSGTAEIDFVLQYGLDIIPIEVKAGDNTAGKSLSVYISKFFPDRCVIYSSKNTRKDGAILHLPIFLCDWTAQMLALCANGDEAQ